MIEKAIPRGTSIRRHTSTGYRQSVVRVGLLILCFLLLAGCGKKPLSGAVALQESGKPGGQGPAASASSQGDGASGRNAILQLPFDQVAKVVLLNIGKAYQFSLASGKPPKNAGELEAGVMKTKRDMQDHEVEVVYGVNPSRLDNPAEYMIAWEKEPTNDGYRMVMMADFTTVKYVSQAEFEKMKKAK